MKCIQVKKCGECDYITTGFGISRCRKTHKTVDPEAIHKDCPLDDMLEWISLKDDQPEEYEWVLAGRSGKNSAVCEARFKKGKFLTSHYNDVDEFIGATHFMRKPEPPKN